MTDGIRDMIKKRRKLFKRLKRRGNWRLLKERVEEIVKERKRVCNNNIIASFVNNKNSKNFHRAVKRLLGENSPPP